MRAAIKVKIVRGGHFGPFCKTEETAAIVVLGWKSPGPLTPLDVRLSHQLYTRDVRELLKEWEEIWTIPCATKTLIAKRPAK